MVGQVSRLLGDFLSFRQAKVSWLVCFILLSTFRSALAQDGSCTNAWTTTSLTNAPTGRSDHTAVWTGTEMIVWGGLDSLTIVNTGGKYNPSTDSWTATSTTNAPVARDDHVAVWTGNEMIIWGGYTGTTYVDTGARYNPATDSWTPISTTNAPAARAHHNAVWTGNEMIVWGGRNPNLLNTGARYNPSTDTWTPMSTVNAPDGRIFYAAVWTGTEMIVWGGYSGAANLNTGGRYNPSTDSWAATNTINAPTGRGDVTGVWSGGEMIVWGGYDGNYLNTGGRYNPTTDSWVPTTTVNAPIGRAYHTSVWSGAEMIIWGGQEKDFLNTGGRYDPSADSWTATNVDNAPTGRDFHTAVWNGSQMIIWGGYGTGLVNSGGRYCAGTGPTPSPTATPTSTATPSPTAAPSPAQALNISTRMRVDTGDNVLIGGFIITGNAAKIVAVRGLGPSLGAAGVPDALADPTLELRNSSGVLLIQDDNWQDDQNQAAELTALGLGLPDPNESGLIASLQPNAYTAVLAGKNGGTGVGLVEVYDTNPAATSQLANISTRGFVLTENNVMIGGFILGGTNNTNVVIRGIGPSLAGVPNALADPTLELHDGNGALLVLNDNWQDDSGSAAQLTALGLAPQNPLESGIYMSLTPGAFTAILAGKNATTGVGLVEVYNVH